MHCCFRPAASTGAFADDCHALLSRNYKLLSRCLVVSDQLLLELEFVDYIGDKVSQIRRERISDQKVTKLLKILKTVPKRHRQSVYSDLLTALREDGQEHVANIFVPESDARPMSDEHYQLLVSKQQHVYQYIDPMNGLVDELVTLGVFTQKDRNRIIDMNSYDEKSNEVVGVILHRPDSTFDKFIETLTNTEQQHVVHILTGQGESPLSHLRRSELRKTREKLISRVDTLHTSLLAELISSGVLTDDDKQRIEAHEVNEDRTAALIDVIARKSQDAYDKFIHALKVSGHPQVAKELEGLELRGPITLFFSDTLSAESNRIVGVVRNNMKALVSGKGTEISEITCYMVQNGFAVSGISEGRIHIGFRCFTEESLVNLKRLYTDKTLDKLLTQVFCSPFAEQGLKSLTLRIADSEFQKATENLHKMTVLPLELLELVLMRTFIKLFTGYYKSHCKTHEATRLAYSTLAGVCNNWWQTMNGTTQSTTKHWFKHKLHQALKLVV